jgi:hypothetical protein
MCRMIGIAALVVFALSAPVHEAVAQSRPGCDSQSSSNRPGGRAALNEEKLGSDFDKGLGGRQRGNCDPNLDTTPTTLTPGAAIICNQYGNSTGRTYFGDGGIPKICP